ncbi:MAG: MlaD family protein [Pseudomonadota bacterium]|nr:MlaD family protein [Pseudomonadota bacterium]
MSDNSKIKMMLKRPNISWVVWFFPAIAVILTSWLFYDYFQHRGPLIKIIFTDASSVEAQKTPLRYRGINVGKVENIVLSRDGKEVVVFARLTKDAKRLAVVGTKFWVVQPEVDFEGVRGLETIFRGSYIRVEPGKGKSSLLFRGQTGNEINDTTADTVMYRLQTPLSESINVGDTVTYRGLKVGSVSGMKLSPKSQLIEVQVSIEKQYAKLIRTNTVFWRKTGIQANLGLFNSEIKISSLESLMRGGIALAIPNEPGPIAKSQTVFSLESSQPKSVEKWVPEI